MSLDRFYSRSGHLIRRLNQISVAMFLDATADFDITPRQFAALNMIREVPNIDQVSLSNMIAVDRTTIVKVLDRLADKGLITRSRSPTDRRTNFLNATPKGLELLRRIEPILDRNDQRILSSLTRADQRKFMELLTQLVHVNNVYSRAPVDPDLYDKATKGRTPARKR